ncbi:hypothetical protein MRB53_030086 [Persea americana]|uniref:Uncharacterized protein n=1 Tax=Persea americana TaxID=3435 RepID=A0ACC2KL96_PERAE|nr:hypothetical protein MRB53_030086 [Persea americana]
MISLQLDISQKFDQVTHILNGLPEDYDPVVMNVAVANQAAQIPVAYLHGLVLDMEIRIAHHRASASSPLDQTSTALFIQKMVPITILAIVVDATVAIEDVANKGVVDPLNLKGQLKITMSLV